MVFIRSSRSSLMKCMLLLGLFAVASSAEGQQPIRLTLQGAVDLAQSQGAQALAARSTRDAARQRNRAFRADLLPQLSMTGTLPSLNRSIIPVLQPDGSTVFRTQEQNEGSLTATVTQRLPFVGGDLFVNSALSRLEIIGNQNTRTWSSTPVLVGIRQEIFRPNQLKWNSKEQELQAEIAERSYAESMEDVAIAAANAFFDYYNAKLALENAVNNAAVNDTLYTLNNGRFEVGKIGENDLLQSELALLRSRVALDGARLDHDRTLASLRLVLNLAHDVELDLEVPIDIPELAPDTTLAVSQAMNNRAQSMDIDLQHVRADRSITEARYGSGVGATLQASMGFNQTGPEMNSVYRDLREAQRLNLSLTMPIVQWGGRSARIQAAKSEGERVDHVTRQNREQMAQEAHFAALELAQARRSLAIAAKADTVGAKRFEVAKNRYVIGRIGMDNLYMAQSEKDGALQQYLQSLRGYWISYYRLRRVTMYDWISERPIR